MWPYSAIRYKADIVLAWRMLTWEAEESNHSKVKDFGGWQGKFLTAAWPLGDNSYFFGLGGLKTTKG